MYKKLYKFHVDPGHGWLEVSKQELFDLDIYKQISQFSYEKRGTVYLEEDCDARYFFEAYEKVAGHAPEFMIVKHNYDAPCRKFPRFVTSYNWK